MKRSICALTLAAALFSSCAKRDTADTAKQSAAESGQPAQAPGVAHAVVHLQDGTKVPGSIVASNQDDMVLAGDDGIERKIPLAQVKSVDYATPAKPAPNAPLAQPPAAAPPPTATTLELPAGAELSVRTNETIDSATAHEGQTFDAQLTRDARDSGGGVVIPRGAPARIVIRSVSKGGRFKGESDLVLDLASVTIGGRAYHVDTADIVRKGKPGVGKNKRTAVYTGGGAALGAIIGAIAGGGKGAAIGAGAGAGAGALTQSFTKGAAIRIPAESVLTFRLDEPLRVKALD